MKIRIVGQTGNIGNDMIDTYAEKVYGGKQAAICYSNKGYFDGIDMEQNEASIKRYDRTISQAHVSIGNHYHITMYFNELPKIMAMIFNSFIFYNTSEKSGRYTNMNNNNELYDKWLDIFKREIKNKYPELPDSKVEKLAYENARYILPVTNPTSAMSYTTTGIRYRQLMYYFRIFISEIVTSHSYITYPDNVHALVEEGYINQNLYPNFDMIRQDRRIDFLLCLVKNMADYIEQCIVYGLSEIIDEYQKRIPLFAEEYIEDCPISVPIMSDKSDSYTYQANMTHVSLADLQRHRTTTMKFSYHDMDIAYIPKILRDHDGEVLSELCMQWLYDMNTLSYIPQGEMVTVRESGTIDAFMEKFTKRTCARVQLEVKEHVDSVLSSIRDMCPDMLNGVITKLYHNNQPNIKCNILGDCREKCEYYKNPEKNNTRFA